MLGGSEVITAWCAIPSSDRVLLAETCGSPSIEIVGVSRVGRIGIVAGSRQIAGQHPARKPIKIGQKVK